MEKIPSISTVSFIEEVPTDGHSPMYFLCEDGVSYFCKHRTSIKREEIQCLFYEVLCTVLLKKLNVPTSKIALVTIVEGSYDKDRIKANRYIGNDTVCFGSKEISGADLLTNIYLVRTRSDFSKFSNPEDLIRIAIFDFWVMNGDRGKVNGEVDIRSNNYNILIKAKDDRTEIVAFDHAFTFGAPTFFTLINPEKSLSFESGLLNTVFAKELLKYIPKGKQVEIVDNFINLIKKLPLDEIIDDVIKAIPEEWIFHKKIITGLKGFLSNGTRIEAIRTHTKGLITK